MPGSTQPLWDALSAQVSSGWCPGLVAGVRIAGETEVRAFGALDTARTAPVLPSTPFRISSLSKLFGGALALDLVAEGRLRLDDDVSRWLPGLGGLRVLASPDAPLSVTVPVRGPVTLRHLLTFTAGFGIDFGETPYSAATRGLLWGPNPPDMDPDTYLATPGFGAAGGLPLALVALLGAETVPGAELVADAVGLQSALARADVILTGEGCLDTQSLGGKVVDAVRRLAPAASPLVVVAGTVRLSAAECRDAGITTAVSLARGPATLEELTEDAELLIEDAAARACSGLAAAGRSPRRFGLAKHA